MTDTDPTMDQQIRQWLPMARRLAYRFARRNRCCRLQSESDAMLGLWEALRKLDPTRAGKPQTWIAGIVSRRLIDGARQFGLYRRSGVPLGHARLGREPASPDAGLALVESVDSRDAILRSLPPVHRQAISMIVDGWSQKEVAAVVGLSACRVSQIVDECQDYVAR